MEQETMAAQTIETVGTDVLYDESVKRLLANKSILAVILKECVPEFKHCTTREIAEQYIEGEPQIGEVGIAPDETNRSGEVIHGLNTEDATLTEGSIRYDIRFYASAPGEDGLIGLIINLEAQNRFNPGYPLLKWAIYYCSRMISAQYGAEFTKSEYGNIKKVYSIWICSNPPKDRRNTITQYSIREEQIVGEAKEEVKNYDLMSAVMICLGEETDRNYSGLLKFLEVLLSDEKTAAAKKTILQNEFDVPMTQTLETEVYQMCNLSQGAIEKGIQKGMQQGIQQGIGQGREEERIASVRNLMHNLHMTAEDAMKVLNIPQEDRDRIKQALAN